MKAWNNPLTWSIPILVLCCAAPVHAQKLRHAVADADVVVTARQVGTQPLGAELFVHRLETVARLKGTAPDHFSIVERKRVADQPRPSPAKIRIYCLEEDRSLPDLPLRFAPYFRMSGQAGSNPPVEDPPHSDPNLGLCRALISSELGRSPTETTDALFSIALRAAGTTARTEAVETLRERQVLRDKLSPLQLSAALSRAVGETTDIGYKIALASLCAERRMEGVVEALCLSVATIDDERFPRALGRLARYLHGEDALSVLRPQIGRSSSAEARNRLLLALGSTETENALEALLRLRRVDGPNPAVDAALRAHGSPRALAAVAAEADTKR